MQYQSAIVEGTGVLGLQFDRLIKRGECVGKPARVAEQQRQSKVDKWVGGRECASAKEPRACLLESAQFEKRVALVTEPLCLDRCRSSRINAGHEMMIDE